MALELYQFQFYSVARVAMVMLIVACGVFIADRIVRGIVGLCRDLVKEADNE